MRLLRLGQTGVLGNWGAKISPSSQLSSSDPLSASPSKDRRGDCVAFFYHSLFKVCGLRLLPLFKLFYFVWNPSTVVTLLWGLPPLRHDKALLWRLFFPLLAMSIFSEWYAMSGFAPDLVFVGWASLAIACCLSSFERTTL